MFKTEPHLHTSEVSACGKLTAAETVSLYHAAGYRTLFVSDHFQTSTLNRFGDLSWTEKIAHFCAGYEAAKAAGEKLGMHVLLSAELHLDGNPNHYLLYGIDRAFLESRPDVFSMTMDDFYPYAKAKGITIVQAHPMRDRYCYPTPEYADGFEVYNSNPRHENFTDEVLPIAQKHGMYITAGSDCHCLEDVGCGGVLSEEEIRSADDYIRLLRENKLVCITSAP